MHRLLSLVSLVFLASCGGGGDAAPPSVAGTWNAASQVAGSSLTMALTEQNSQIAGVGTYRVEAGPSGAIAVAGAQSGQAVALELVYDNGTKASYAATVQDASHMSGVLAFEGGSASTVQFVRQ